MQNARISPNAISFELLYGGFVSCNIQALYIQKKKKKKTQLHICPIVFFFFFFFFFFFVLF